MFTIASTFDSLFTMPMPIGEKVIRTIAVYLIVVVLLRIMGRRTVAQLNAFDLVVLLLLSNVVQNAIIGPDNSLVGGAIGVVTLLLLNAAVVWVVRKNSWLDKVMEGDTVVLVHDGKVDHHALQHLGIREGDLKAALLNQGAEGSTTCTRPRCTPRARSSWSSPSRPGMRARWTWTGWSARSTSSRQRWRA